MNNQDSNSPPAFAGEAWYASVGGNDVDEYLRRIYEDQYPRFEGEVARERHAFASPGEASSELKEGTGIRGLRVSRFPSAMVDPGR